MNLTIDPAVASSLRRLLHQLWQRGIHFADGFTMDDLATLSAVAGEYRRIALPLMTQLAAIEPVDAGSVTYRPCAALGADGQWREAVYFADALSWFRTWGPGPDEDRAKLEIKVQDVVEIRESRLRLPARFAAQLYAAGESGMGYTTFEVEFSDGAKKACSAGNAVDFIHYPPEKGPRDVVAVYPRAGEMHDAPVEYVWCLYADS